MCMFLISLTSAGVGTLGTFKKGESIDLIQTCEDCTYVNITSILYPNNSQAIGQVAMTRDGTYFNYTLTPNYTDTSGVYVVNGLGDEGGSNTVWRYTFEVTSAGRIAPTEGEGVIYLGTLFAMILFAVFFFILSYQFKPSKDAQQNEDGSYNPIPNDKPALRFGCLALSFIIGFIVVLYAMVSMQTAFSGFEKIINSYYVFMWIVGFLFVLIFIFVLITLLIQAVDSIRQKRGLSGV